MKNIGNLLFNSNDINFCLRSYFDHWGIIITAKLIFFVINPFILYFVKNKNKKLIYVDSEYTAITSKLEICICFQ